MDKPQCPKCGRELNEEFGMVTCSGCGSVLFIDFEGQAQLADDPSPSLGEVRGTAAHDQPPPDEMPDEMPDTMPDKMPDKMPDEASIESFSNYESVAPLAGEIAVEPSADGIFEAGSPSQSEAPNEALDISAYANSEASQAKGGPLTYTVHIDGLDSKELRDSLREALSESRFAWDPQGLMATIREGKLTLESVQPIKASVLVNRLKRLPLKIWWEQNAVTESGP